jgi:hypothetical protein
MEVAARRDRSQPHCFGEQRDNLLLLLVKLDANLRIRSGRTADRWIRADQRYAQGQCRATWMSLAHSDANTSVSALSTKSLHATDSVISTHTVTLTSAPAEGRTGFAGLSSQHPLRRPRRRSPERDQMTAGKCVTFGARCVARPVCSLHRSLCRPCFGNTEDPVRPLHST